MVLGLDVWGTDPEVPHFEYVTRFRGLQYVRDNLRNRREGHKWGRTGRRGLRAQSGGVRWACRFSLTLVKFSRQKVDPADECIAGYAAGSKRGGGDNSTSDVYEIEILGRLYPPTRSLSGLRDWPYMTSFKRCVRPFRNDLGEGVPA